MVARKARVFERWIQAYDAECRQGIQASYQTEERPSHVRCHTCRREYAFVSGSNYPLAGVTKGEAKYFTEVRKEG